MARAAGKARQSMLGDIGAMIWEATPERREFTLRLALLAAITTLIVATYETPQAALSAYMVFFLNKPDRMTSLIMNVAMLLLVTIVIGIVILLAIQVIDHPAWRIATMAGMSIAMLFLASASKLKPVGATLAMIIAYALDTLGTVPAGELGTRGLLYTWLAIAIPAAVSVVVNLLIAPSPLRLAERSLARSLNAAAALLEEPGDEAAEQVARCQEEAGEILVRLKLAGLEHVRRETLAALVQATHSTSAILFLAGAIAAEPSVAADWRDEASRTLREMAAILHKGGYPIGIETEALRAAEPYDGLAATLSADLAAAISGFAAVSDQPVPAPAPAHAGGGFFLPDAFTNPSYLRYALKATFAAMLCYIFYSLLDWPGIHTCFITCYVVALGTTAETIEKLSLRLFGCLVGAAAGIAAIVFVMPALDTVAGLVGVVFVGTLAGAWIAGGSPRIAYAGFQMAFAFYLCVIQGDSPAFDLTIVRDRLIGILIGNIAIYLVFTRVWPVSIAARIDPAIAALLRSLGQAARATDIARRSFAPSVSTQLEALQTDLSVLPYEPRAVRPSPDWIRVRTEAVAAIAGMEKPLQLSGDDMPHVLGSAAARLERLADQLAPGTASATSPLVPAPSTAVMGKRQPFLDRLAGQLTILEHRFAQ